MLFGYVKQEEVLNCIKKEMELNHQLYVKYDKLASSHRECIDESEYFAKEADRCAEMAANYFTRYLQCRELLAEVNKL